MNIVINKLNIAIILLASHVNTSYVNVLPVSSQYGVLISSLLPLQSIESL